MLKAPITEHQKSVP
ncbi:hypothetical protein O8C69_25600, partial [Enterobacter hormaechei subsp. steigerwaltii]|nr:hypothetical protein [Enterobacter hormaechei subsp. steigerwaltii]